MQMLNVLGVSPEEGEVGIEIELEGENLPREAFGSWRAEADGSLRGESIELVLKKPCPRDKVRTRLNAVLHKLDALDSNVVQSDRAGIHVHVNVQDLTEIQLINFICLYMTYEDMLVEFCGKNRVGNLFCLRTQDASGYLDLLRTAVQTGQYGLLGTDEVRYASMNLKALVQYGSLEFRAMRSTIDKVVIEDWVKLLLCLKDRAKDFDNPIGIIEQFSVEGTEAAYAATFGDMCDRLVFDPVSMVTGMRNAQLIAYCRADWGERVEDPDDEDEGLVLADEKTLEKKRHEATREGIIHFIYKGEHQYYVKASPECFPRRHDKVWYTADEIMDLNENVDEDLSPWDQHAKEYVMRQYREHASRQVRKLFRQILGEE